MDDLPTSFLTALWRLESILQRERQRPEPPAPGIWHESVLDIDVIVE